MERIYIEFLDPMTEEKIIKPHSEMHALFCLFPILIKVHKEILEQMTKDSSAANVMLANSGKNIFSKYAFLPIEIRISHRRTRFGG